MFHSFVIFDYNGAVIQGPLSGIYAPARRIIHRQLCIGCCLALQYGCSSLWPTGVASGAFKNGPGKGFSPPLPYARGLWLHALHQQWRLLLLPRVPYNQMVHPASGVYNPSPRKQMCRAAFHIQPLCMYRERRWTTATMVSACLVTDSIASFKLVISLYAASAFALRSAVSVSLIWPS